MRIPRSATPQRGGLPQITRPGLLDVPGDDVPEDLALFYVEDIHALGHFLRSCREPGSVSEHKGRRLLVVGHSSEGQKGALPL